jgi:hypothetical protein
MTNFMSTTSASDALVIRRATAADSARIRTLALLDDRRMPAGPFLVAELGGEIVAARSLSTDGVMADPFRLTSDIVAMLRLRAGQASELLGHRAQRSASGGSFDAALAA